MGRIIKKSCDTWSSLHHNDIIPYHIHSAQHTEQLRQLLVMGQTLGAPPPSKYGKTRSSFVLPSSEKNFSLVEENLETGFHLQCWRSYSHYHV